MRYWNYKSQKKWQKSFINNVFAHKTKRYDTFSKILMNKPELLNDKNSHIPRKSMGVRPTQLTENRKNRLAKLFRILTCQMCRSDTHALGQELYYKHLSAVWHGQTPATPVRLRTQG